jgi:hypothetical protein
MSTRNPNDVMLSASEASAFPAADKVDSSASPQNDIQASMQFMQPIFEGGTKVPAHS